MNKYKFKIGDMVAVTHSMHIGSEVDYFGELIGRRFVITERSKGQIGNSYEVTDRETDECYAWVYEQQMDFSENVSDEFLKKQYELRKNLIEKEKKKRQETYEKLFDQCETDEQREKLFMIVNPFAYAFYKAINESVIEMKMDIDKKGRAKYFNTSNGRKYI